MRISTAVRRAPKAVCNAVRDLRYGGFLGGTIHTRSPHLEANDIANSDYDHLQQLFAEVQIGPDDVLVDVGCGKGRAINWFLSRYPNNKVYGIELDAEVCARTRARLRRFSNVNILCGDAIELLPSDGTVFYLYNPFGESVMRKFISKVLEPPRTHARRTTIVYSCAQWLDMFRSDPNFNVRDVDVPVRHGAAVIELQ
jgi:SAM-dependent methyltransferase